MSARAAGMLSYTRTGTSGGPLVLFLHGAAIDSWMWEAVVADLPHIEALLIDLPGHGASRDVPWRDLATTAKAVGDVLDAVAPARAAHLVGVSLGSYVGLTLLAQRPERFTSAVLSGMHAGGMDNRLLMRALAFLMAPLVQTRWFARKNATLLVGTAVDLERFATEATKTRPRAYRRATNDVVDFELPAGLGRISTRTLFVAGGKEHQLIVGALPRLAAALPQGQAATAPGLGHGWPGQDPALFAATVQAALEASPLPPGLVAD